MQISYHVIIRDRTLGGKNEMTIEIVKKTSIFLTDFVIEAKHHENQGPKINLKRCDMDRVQKLRIF